jgi:hypothetical protein
MSSSAEHTPVLNQVNPTRAAAMEEANEAAPPHPRRMTRAAFAGQPGQHSEDCTAGPVRLGWVTQCCSTATS